MAFDLASLDLASAADRGAWCILRHPGTGEDLPIRIKIAGTDSQRWMAQERAFQDARLEKVHRQNKAPKILSKDLEKRAVKILSAVTMEWETSDGERWQSFIEFRGEKLQCNPANAERLYSDPGFVWIRTQLDEFAGDPANYNPESEEKPAPSLTDGEAFMASVMGN